MTNILLFLILMALAPTLAWGLVKFIGKLIMFVLVMIVIVVIVAAMHH